MQEEVQEAVARSSSDVLVLGRSSWDPDATSLKYAWPDKNGRRARGGELPTTAISQAVLFAAREGYLTRDQVSELAKDLIDVLTTSG